LEKHAITFDTTTLGTTPLSMRGRERARGLEGRVEGERRTGTEETGTEEQKGMQEKPFQAQPQALSRFSPSDSKTSKQQKSEQREREEKRDAVRCRDHDGQRLREIQHARWRMMQGWAEIERD
jgi:hypothetical protein